MSSDPVALDRLLFDRMNAMRVLEGFPEIYPLPRQLPFAASLGLGEFETDRIQIQKIPLSESSAPGNPMPELEPFDLPNSEPANSGLRQNTPSDS